MLLDHASFLDKNHFYLVTSAEYHVCMNLDLLTDYRPLATPKQPSDPFSEGNIRGWGTLKLMTEDGRIITIPKVAYIPESRNNQLNPLSLTSNGNDHVLFHSSGVRHMGLGEIGVHERSTTRLYRLTLPIIRPETRIPKLNPIDKDAFYLLDDAIMNITRDWTMLHNYKASSAKKYVGISDTINDEILGYGDLWLRIGSTGIKILNIAYVPGFKWNLLDTNELLPILAECILTGKCTEVPHTCQGHAGNHGCPPQKVYKLTLPVSRPDNRANQSYKKRKLER